MRFSISGVDLLKQNSVKNMTKFMHRLKKEMMSSFYLHCIKNYMTVMGICFAIASFLVFLSYPGVMYTDSYERILMADDTEKWIYAFCHGDAELTIAHSWLTIAPSFFIQLSIKIVGSVALYTFFQAFSFLFVSIIFANKLIETKKKSYCFWILLVPIFAGYSVYYEASVGCITAIMAICLLIWNPACINTLLDKSLTAIFISFLSFIIWGFRANAITILPIFILIIFINYRDIRKRLNFLIPILLGLFLVSYVPKAFNINTMSSYAAGFMWETISTIQEMEDDDKEQYSTYLDDIFGDGATKQVLEKSRYKDKGDSINSYLWSGNYNGVLSQDDNAKQVLIKYLNIIIQEPVTYLKTKWRFTLNTLGISYPINNYEYYYNRNDQMKEYGYNDSAQRKFFVDYYNSYVEYMKVFRMPWLLYLLALGLIIIWKFKFTDKEKKKVCNIYETSFLIALFYYGAYVIDTQSFEFRYFFPAWLLLFFVIVSLSIKIVGKLNVHYLKCISVCICIFVLFQSLIGGMKILNENGNQTIDYVESNGLLLSETNYNKTYYIDNKLFFIADKRANTGYEYFLRYIKTDGSTINDDFSYGNDKMYSSRNKGSIVEKSIPLDDIAGIEYGQFYGEMIFWKESVPINNILSIPENVDILEYSDD